MLHEEIIFSTIEIKASPAAIWPKITNVRIEEFSHPFIFRILDIPKPLTAELFGEGLGGRREAHFGNGKKFTQLTTVWEPLKVYAFTFHPDPGFKVGYFYDLASGFFQVIAGAYRLETEGNKTRLRLETRYGLKGISHSFLNLPIRMILNSFQNFLLKSIRTNREGKGN